MGDDELHLFPEFAGVAPTHTCGYGTTLANACGKPAGWHVLWDSQGSAAVECEFHHRVVRIRWAFYADHPFDPDCCLPGASYDVKLNRCFWPEETWWDRLETWMAETEPIHQ